LSSYLIFYSSYGCLGFYTRDVGCTTLGCSTDLKSSVFSLARPSASLVPSFCSSFCCSCRSTFCSRARRKDSMAARWASRSISSSCRSVPPQFLGSGAFPLSLEGPSLWDSALSARGFRRLRTRSLASIFFRSVLLN